LDAIQELVSDRMGRDSFHTLIHGVLSPTTAALSVFLALLASSPEAEAAQPGTVRPQVIRTISESGGDVINAVEMIAMPTAYYRTAPIHRLPSIPKRPSVCPATQRNNVSMLREGFVLEILDLALTAGRELGVDSRAIVAQAALETGWGTRHIRRRDGTSAHNLFGIKASRWNGDVVRTSTHEQVGGLLRREMASFRAYGSHAESFADYVQLLKTNSRYQGALQSGGSVLRFANALQQAGYATDPNYAAKIYDIANSETMDCAYRTYASTNRSAYSIASIK
jgi:flagellum-specific peptidoglycan hydrolase FlgJ